uniref:N-acetylmuramoyl-L-alanine amidase n=1 Tax=Bacteriophage sp. TaxID=38018 RepID=A0A8D9UHC2_9VIRU|nr:MAG TPA: PGRP protein [Bacteriophage sp.]
MVHSTGCNNPNLKRYVQPSTNDSNYNTLISQLGKNNGGTAWNKSNTNVCVHAFIGKLANGEIATVQTLPWNYKGWHCGKGNKGSRNLSHISFEMCEDSLSDTNYFNKVYKEAVEFAAYLCQLYNFDPLADGVIIGHYEGHQRGIASNHADPRNWFPRFGKSMDTFRQDVAAKMGKVIPVAPSNTEITVSYSGVVTASVLRIRKGPSVSSSIAGTLKKGTVVSIILEDNGWGKLADGSGWVSLTYIKKSATSVKTFKNYKGKITASSGVNIRTGAGINYNKNGAVTYNSVVTIVDEE